MSAFASLGQPALVGPTDRYFAACDVEDLPGVLLDKAEKYRDRLRKEGRIDLWRRAERTYYGQDANGGMANSVAVTFGGDSGEVVMIRVNHYASIVKALLALAVSKRPSYEPRAQNSDAASAQAVTLARSLLEFYSRELDLEGVRMDTARMAVVFGESYSAVRWNRHIGKPIGYEPVEQQDPNAPAALSEPQQPPDMDAPAALSEPQQPTRVVREGDVEAHTLTPLEVIHDLDNTTRGWKWTVLAYRENAWDLAARYPDHREEILAMRGGAQHRWARSAWTDTPWEASSVESDPDIITVWWFYHLPTDSLPEGRQSIVCGQAVLEDGPMMLDVIPVQQLAPEREITLMRGHTSMHDLLALQDAYDAAVDSILSQIDSHSLPNVLMAKGTDIDENELSGGLKLIRYEPNPDAPNAGAPSVLNLLDISPELVATVNFLKQQMETISGINSVIRGEPMPQLKSGAALALVQSLAVQYNTSLQASVIRHDEQLATRLITMLKKYATSPRQIEIVGRAQRSALGEWSADKLAPVERIVIEAANPMQETTAGRLELATMLLSAKGANGQPMINTPQEVIEVLTTGRLEPIYRGPKAELDLIARENEDLAAGTPCVVLDTDDQELHIAEHKAVLAESSVRSNPQLAQVTQQHIAEHKNILAQRALAQAKIAQHPLMQGAPPPAPAGPPHGAPPAHGPQHASQADKAKPMGGPPPVGGPSMPRSPLTHQPAPNPSAT